MIRSKTPKEEDFTEENLVGKTIVDPNGHILANCVGVFKDEKNKLRLRISIKTELDSDFIVEETIPVQLISKIGEVILLKRLFEIQPISTEDLVMVEILDEVDKTEEQDMKEKDSKNKPSNNQSIKPSTKKVSEISKLPKNKVKSKYQCLTTKTSTKERETKNQMEIAFKESFKKIVDEKDNETKQILIIELINKLKKNKKFRKRALSNLLKQMVTTDLQIRLSAALILNKISENSPELLVPVFLEGLQSVYNEPSKEVEQVIIRWLTRTATTKNEEILILDLNDFFGKLIIDGKMCKNITKNRIHNLNLKIFVNNFDIQEIIVNNYIYKISKNKDDATEFVKLLEDYNAIIIAYGLIRSVDQTKWNSFLESKYVKGVFEKPFKDSISNFLFHFKECNIKKISEVVDPKLGYNFSNKIINNMIKCRIDDVLSNVTILPLDVLSSFFQDDANSAIQILFDLINKQEIDAQIVFIENKTYISPRDK